MLGTSGFASSEVFGRGRHHWPAGDGGRGIAARSTATSHPQFNLVTPLRVSEEEETQGLDVVMHNETPVSIAPQVNLMVPNPLADGIDLEESIRIPNIIEVYFIRIFAPPR